MSKKQAMQLSACCDSNHKHMLCVTRAKCISVVSRRGSQISYLMPCMRRYSCTVNSGLHCVHSCIAPVRLDASTGVQISCKGATIWIQWAQCQRIMARSRQSVAQSIDLSSHVMLEMLAAGLTTGGVNEQRLSAARRPFQLQPGHITLQSQKVW